MTTEENLCRVTVRINTAKTVIDTTINAGRAAGVMVAEEMLRGAIYGLTNYLGPEGAYAILQRVLDESIGPVRGDAFFIVKPAGEKA
jgi:hypothetical protein